MPPFDATIGTIHCRTNKAMIDALLFPFGLRACSTQEPDAFCIVNGARDSEPEVDRDLWDLALVTLRNAERDGTLPRFSVSMMSARRRPH